MSEDFKIWWHREGSGMPPLKGEDTCEHVERVSAIAWSNGAYKATEALEAENARLKAEVERLTAIVGADAIDRKHGMCCDASAQVERLTKAGDAMADQLWPQCGCQECEEIIDCWLDAKRAAKDGKPRA
jgi:hypothetical protein